MGLQFVSCLRMPDFQIQIATVFSIQKKKKKDLFKEIMTAYILR